MTTDPGTSEVLILIPYKEAWPLLVSLGAFLQSDWINQGHMTTPEPMPVRGWQMSVGFLNHSLASEDGMTLKVSQSGPIARYGQSQQHRNSAAKLQGLKMPGGGAEDSPSSWILRSFAMPTLGIEDVQSEQEYMQLHL